jgi:hypothetical protein
VAGERGTGRFDGRREAVGLLRRPPIESSDDFVFFVPFATS